MRYRVDQEIVHFLKGFPIWGGRKITGDLRILLLDKKILDLLIKEMLAAWNLVTYTQKL